MSFNKYLLIAFVAATVAAYVAARPQGFKEFVVGDIANKTMCPIKVEINENPDRIPRRIKYLKCAERPNKMCSEHHMSHGCCKHHHHAYRTECVEIYDFVQVTFKDPMEQKTIKVPVGCTCLILENTTPTDIS